MEIVGKYSLSLRVAIPLVLVLFKIEDNGYTGISNILPQTYPLLRTAGAMVKDLLTTLNMMMMSLESETNTRQDERHTGKEREGRGDDDYSDIL